jgi:hypothetical protein
MTTLDWATALDRLYDVPEDPQIRAWAEEAIAADRCTPGQRRAYGLLTAGRDILDLLADTPVTVRQMLAEADPQRLATAPAEGEWTVVQVVHHLADNEAVNAVRLRSVLTEDTPEMFGYDSDPWSRFFDLEPVEDALVRFETARRNTVALARSLSPADLDRKGVLSYRGAESVRVVLAVLAGHDKDHVDQLRATIDATR